VYHNIKNLKNQDYLITEPLTSVGLRKSSASFSTPAIGCGSVCASNTKRLRFLNFVKNMSTFRHQLYPYYVLGDSLFVAAQSLHPGFSTFLRSRATWAACIVNAYHFFQNNQLI